MRYLYLWWSLHSDIGLLSIEPRTAGEDEDSLSIITLCIYSLFKFCQDEAVLWPSQESRPRSSLLYFASGAHWWFGVFRNVKAGHWQPQPPSLPFLRVSTNRPINHQNKLTVYKQHNHNAKYKRWVLSLNNGLWLVETAKMTSILASDWARPKYWPPEMEELIRANA